MRAAPSENLIGIRANYRPFNKASHKDTKIFSLRHRGTRPEPPELRSWTAGSDRCPARFVFPD